MSHRGQQEHVSQFSIIRTKSWDNKLLKRKGSLFWGAQSVTSWPHCFGLWEGIIVEVHVRAKPFTPWPGNKREKEAENKDTHLPSKAHPKAPLPTRPHFLAFPPPLTITNLGTHGPLGNIPDPNCNRSLCPVITQELELKEVPSLCSCAI
jgi:hypothetical protein